jgi:hypothetical protein
LFVRSDALDPEPTYYLRVSAIDLDGHESALSGILEVSLGDAGPNEDSEQDPGAGGDEFNDYSDSGDGPGRESPGVPGRNPSIEQPGRR